MDDWNQVFQSLYLRLNRVLPHSLRPSPDRIRKASHRALLVCTALLIVTGLTPVTAFAAMDADGDGLRNAKELSPLVDTDWQAADTDGDGLDDEFETASPTLNATAADTDHDGANDALEREHGTNASRPDTDGDGLSDGREIDGVTDPTTADTDGDTLSDKREVQGPTDPTVADTDRDGLRDDRELSIGSNATNPDTDGDGLIDGLEWEANTSLTDPDTDGDTLGDLFEASNESLDPLLADTDQDGLTDPEELRGPTKVNVSDTDGDGLLDGPETQNGTDPTVADTDGDTLLDGREIKKYGSDPLQNDTDSDNVTDPVEVCNAGLDVSDLDSDDDGLADGVEWYGVTNASLADTDGDGLDDYNETRVLRTDPVDNDTDGDGLEDGREINVLGTNATSNDSDGDAISDGTEASVDAYDPTSKDPLRGKQADLQITTSQSARLESLVDPLANATRQAAVDAENGKPITAYAELVADLPDADVSGVTVDVISDFQRGALYQLLDIVEAELGVSVGSRAAVRGRLNQALKTGARLSAVSTVLADYSTLHDQAELLTDGDPTNDDAARIGVLIATTVLVVDLYLLTQTGGTFSVVNSQKIAFRAVGKVAAKTRLARLASYCGWKCVGGVERLLHWALRAMIDAGETKLIGAIIRIGEAEVGGMSVVDILRNISVSEYGELVLQLIEFPQLKQAVEEAGEVLNITTGGILSTGVGRVSGPSRRTTARPSR